MKDAPTGTGKTPSSFSHASGVVLLYGDLALLSKRIRVYKGNPTSYPGYWAPFAGAIEEGESPMLAGARELWEESALKVDPLHLVYITEIATEGVSFTLYSYELGSLYSPILNFEHTEYGYFKIDHLHTSPTPICPLVVEAIQDFNSSRRTASW